MWRLDKCILLSKLSILALPYSHRLDDTSAFQQFLKRETKIERYCWDFETMNLPLIIASVIMLMKNTLILKESSVLIDGVVIDIYYYLSRVGTLSISHYRLECIE
jgi:hypothetical protein